MRLQQTYTYKSLNISFKFTPYHKFNIIWDKSGTGKTTLVRELAYNPEDLKFLVWYSSQNIDLIKKETNSILVFDELHLGRFIRAHGIDILNKSPNIFLIICRDILNFTSIDYRAIYELKCKDSNYWLERKYNDYTTFCKSSNYLTEDSGIGFEYYKQHFANIQSANGKNSIFSLLKDDTTIIADGSAFAFQLHKCLSYVGKVKFYLPDSFEGLVLEHTPNARQCVIDSHLDPVLRYLSIEQYYEDKITDFYPTYDKVKLVPDIMKLDLLDLQDIDIHSKREMYFDSCKLGSNYTIDELVQLAPSATCGSLNAISDKEKAYVALAIQGIIKWLPEDS